MVVVAALPTAPLLCKSALQEQEAVWEIKNEAVRTPALVGGDACIMGTQEIKQPGEM